MVRSLSGHLSAYHDRMVVWDGRIRYPGLVETLLHHADPAEARAHQKHHDLESEADCPNQEVARVESGHQNSVQTSLGTLDLATDLA